ncbi:MAG: two-component system, NtrC family, sensor kinase [Myxococcales bacterium]|nr:two-component system, NtrC family, sensor kinase [Myxococcales bacterium]
MLHRHLLRQLRRLGLDLNTPAGPEAWLPFLEAVSRTYDDNDRERYTIERSITLSSKEMLDLNERLAWERDQFAKIFQSALIGMIRIELDGVLSDLNPAFETILGRSRNGIVSQPLWQLAHPDDGAALRSRVESFAQGTATSEIIRCRILHSSGACVHATLGMALVRDEAGRPQFSMAVVEDLTERNRLEIELRHAQKLESVGRLAAGVAHEINTPIQFVGDNVEFLSAAFTDLLSLCAVYQHCCEKAQTAPLLPEDVAQLRAEEARADIEYIRQNAARAIAATIDGVGRVSHIVQSMKAFAHPDRGTHSDADLNAALQTTLTVATNELKYVAAVEVDLGLVPWVPCNVSDLNQVFLNLLINAAHAIGDVVGTTGVRGTIRVRTYCEGDQAVVAISDTGGGIPTHIRSKIFDPFFTTKEVGRGTGQGLALARSVVVEQHSGTLTFESEVGKGTTFWVRLPLKVSAGEGTSASLSDNEEAA